LILRIDKVDNLLHSRLLGSMEPLRMEFFRKEAFRKYV
jgi:hypothetical protein